MCRINIYFYINQIDGDSEMKFENSPPEKKITSIKKALQSAPSKAAKITGF